VKVVDGEAIRTSSVVHGRRLPLVDIRKKFFDKHEQYMHVLPDEAIASMPESDLKVHLAHLHEATDAFRSVSFENDSGLCSVHDPFHFGMTFQHFGPWLYSHNSPGSVRFGCFHD